MKNKQISAWNGLQETKNYYLKRMLAHVKADEIAQGVWWEDGKGCAIGCLLHDDNPSYIETELGIPTWVGYLVEKLFEGLENNDAKSFPIEFIKAVPVRGGRLYFDEIRRLFFVFVLNKNMDLVEKLDIGIELKNRTMEAIKDIRDYYLQDENDLDVLGRMADAADKVVENATNIAMEYATYAAKYTKYANHMVVVNAAKAAASSVMCTEEYAVSGAAVRTMIAAGLMKIECGKISKQMADEFLRLLQEVAGQGNF